MRTTVIVLLVFVVCAAWGRTPERGSTDPTLDPPREDGFRKRLNSTTVNRFHEWRRERAEYFQKHFQKLGSPEKRGLNERIKNLTREHFDRVRLLGDSIAEINKNAAAPEELFQTDIALTDEQLAEIVDGRILTLEGNSSTRQKRTAARVGAQLWTGTIPYYFDSSMSAAAITAIRAGIAFWQANTCIRFQENGSGSNRIRFFRGSGCYSFIGMSGGTQDISIGSGCEYVDVTTHEIAHALGIMHEMSRWDRDSYVTINFNNIQSGLSDNFVQYPQNYINAFGQSFDISSVMQYNPYGFVALHKKWALRFAVNSQTPVIVAKDANYQYSMGFYQPSTKDIFVVNSLYNCFARCSTTISCQNGGLQNPNSCSACICPPGYGGSLCQDRDTSCGETVTVSDTTTTYSIPLLGNYNDGNMATSVNRCSYFFKPSAGFSKVRVSIQSMNAVCDASCSYAGVDIYTKADPRAAGYRFCCTSHRPTLVSEGNLVRVVAFRRVYGVSAVLQVTAVNDDSTPPPTAPTPSPGGSCADASTYCAYWKSVGFCTSSYSTSTQRSYCARTCGFCSSDVPKTSGVTNCVDANPNCPTWQRSGFCSNNTYTTATKSSYCKKTCNLC